MNSTSESALEAAIERIAQVALGDAPERLREAILYSLLGPGKRIRPRMTLAVGDALGLPLDLSTRIAAALEMTHAYTLVHDDLPAMDDDDLRRGRPTNHKVYGEGLAVLAGDALALLGPTVLLTPPSALPAERTLAVVAALLEASGARGVIAGQAAEMDLVSASTGKPNGDPAALFEIFRKKTGALFRAALAMPAIAAGAAPSVVADLGRWGDAIGIAFQIADDLEDDFAAKRNDPAHVAATLTPSAAREAAEGRLAALPVLPGALPDRLAPFVAELRRKLAGEKS